MKIIILGALLMVGTASAAYKRGALAEMRKETSNIESGVLRETARDVTDAIEQGAQPSEILVLIEREITYLLTHRK